MPESYSTLLRRARRAKTKEGAARLLHRANEIRRTTRKKPVAKKVQKPRSNKILKGLKQAVDHAILGINQNSNIGWQVNRGDPGRGEIVSSKPPPAWVSEIENRYDDLAKLVRKRDPEGAKIVMRSLVMGGISQQRRDQDRAQREAIVAHNRQWSSNIVSSFIGLCNEMQRVNRSGLPKTMLVSGLVIARVLDALGEAGWSEDGLSRPVARDEDKS